MSEESIHRSPRLAETLTAAQALLDGFDRIDDYFAASRRLGEALLKHEDALSSLPDEQRAALMELVKTVRSATRPTLRIAAALRLAVDLKALVGDPAPIDVEIDAVARALEATAKGGWG